ncbi:hypothetical protein CDN99_01260 [Roseateles aquatilis]|uniref:Uncharacterized protein n=1 Tax=Roseateles aquatilis TaxID=431061 RepID=A0A246JKJ1_9BURK|nr:flagellar hook-length control protein FliK [Roseateles aquatilis]OWQ93158.1 hypothetical protein CDN99_01260 [Roseateles aquatilis]
MAGSTSNGNVGAVGAVTASSRLQPLLRDLGGLPGLAPGAVLRLAGADRPGAGWRLESLDSGRVMTLIEPPLDDLLPGDEVLLRVRAVAPRVELEVIERRAGGGRDGPAGAWDRPGSGRADMGAGGNSGWGQLAALRVDLAQWRRQLLTTLVPEPAMRTPAALVSAWTLALAHGQVPVGPGGEPLWLLPLPYWVRADRRGGAPDDEASSGSGAPAPAAVSEDAALSLLLRWRGEAIGVQLQGTRTALSITLLAENDQILTALRAELPRLVAALVRVGFRLQRLGWRRQPLWVPVDPFPAMRSEPALLTAAAELVAALS